MELKSFAAAWTNFPPSFVAFGARDKMSILAEPVVGILDDSIGARKAFVTKLTFLVNEHISTLSKNESGVANAGEARRG